MNKVVAASVAGRDDSEDFMRERLVSVDAGGTMTKAAIFDPAGNELACVCYPNTISYPRPGHTERDPDATWRAACAAIKGALEATGTQPGDVAAVTPSGFGAGCFFVDGKGEVVRPGIGSTDARSAAVIEAWRADGIVPILEQQIRQQVWPGQSLPILRWLSLHEPETLARARHVLWCKDFLRLRLCGDISTDPTDAGCAGLADPGREAFAAEALAAAGLGFCLAKLPPIGPAAEVVGRVSPAAARQSGLAAGTPVARGVYDVVGCSLASGVLSRRQLGVVAGTFSINSVLHPAPCLDPLPTLQSSYPVRDQYLATMAAPTSAGNLEWVCKTFLAARAQSAAARARSVYDFCNEQVAEKMGHAGGPFFFPYLFWGPNGAPAGLLGVTASNDLGDVLKAVFEGVVFAHKSDIAPLLAGPAAAPEVIRLAGGAAKSPVWARMFSDCLGLPVEIANGSEFGAKGAAICAAAAIGLHADVEAAVLAMHKIVRRHEPDPLCHETATRRYQAFRALGAQLAEIYPPRAAAQAPGAGGQR